MSAALISESHEHLLRPLAPQVLGLLVRRYGSFDTCEDAVQEALLAAVRQWPQTGVPENPRAWLVTAASRRLIDEFRSDAARRRREEQDALQATPLQAPAHDDSLALLFLCCHGALSPASQIALTLRAVGGLTTAEIASAFLVPEPTMAQRISRAKRTIAEAGARFELQATRPADRRLAAVRQTLYLIFNEGYTASSGAQIQRRELAHEAIRLTRMLHRLLPDDDEVTGLLALMLLTDARHRARTGPSGELIPLAEQDRSRWDRRQIATGVALTEGVLTTGPVGPFQLQAAIAAVHAEAPSADDTDWRQITALYELLERVAPNPVFTLNRAVALAMCQGPQAGLDLLAELEEDARLATSHRVQAVRGHLLELAGDRAAAAGAYHAAARLTSSLPERDYLLRKAAASAG
ncbi:MAG TPA: sigma-70 family RNA polymerase sigma factor [Solirubrobacteraceae bacterium]|jgi:RNA polymerase sigma factor (sigma-70 family)|nr:sigma-70 family RNA polymerase sigma factor [Solirubrobacteraceae bacterium]